MITDKFPVGLYPKQAIVGSEKRQHGATDFIFLQFFSDAEKLEARIMKIVSLAVTLSNVVCFSASAVNCAFSYADLYGSLSYM